MSVILNGTTQYLKLSNAVAKLNGGSLFPCTISCWMKTTDLAQTSALVSADDASSNQNLTQFRGSVAGDYVAAACYDGAWDLAVTSTGVSSDTWHHVLAVFASTTDRRIYIDGGSKGTDGGTANSGPGAAGDLGVGARFPDGTPSLFFGGKLAEVAVWDIALSDANAVSLAGGDLASTVEAGDLIWYWTLYDDPNNGGGTESDNLTEANAPTYDDADHPVIHATYVDMAGTFDVAVGATGDLSVATAVDIAGTFDVAIGVTGALFVGAVVDIAGTFAVAVGTAAALQIQEIPKSIVSQAGRRLIAIGNNTLYYEDI